MNDLTVDWQNLHVCNLCEARLRLRVFPNSVGWVLGTGCSCRDNLGGPRRYSTDSEPYLSFEDVVKAHAEMFGVAA